MQTSLYGSFPIQGGHRMRGCRWCQRTRRACQTCASLKHAYTSCATHPSSLDRSLPGPTSPVLHQTRARCRARCTGMAASQHLTTQVRRRAAGCRWRKVCWTRWSTRTLRCCRRTSLQGAQALPACLSSSVMSCAKSSRRSQVGTLIMLQHRVACTYMLCNRAALP